jgi:predicted RNase H-like HicB family nuclease
MTTEVWLEVVRQRGSHVRVRYRVVFERDDGRAWIARVPSVRGCHTYGRTIDQARKRIREALALWVGDAEKAEFVEEIRLPARALEAVRRSRDARRRATEQREKAHETTAEAARTLVDDLDLGLRDAADLLGLSHQRVQQLVRS